MIVVISNEAENNLEQIADYIAENNPTRALSFVRELRERCENLTTMPKGFPLVPRYEHLGIRRCIHGSYLVFYRLNGSEIIVLNILHGAMNYEPLLFPEN